jgi:hypothetical protein
MRTFTEFCVWINFRIWHVCDVAKKGFNVYWLNCLINTNGNKRSEHLVYGGSRIKIWQEGRSENEGCLYTTRARVNEMHNFKVNEPQ